MSISKSAEKPFWTNTSRIVAATSTADICTAASTVVRSLRFQLALLTSDRKLAMSDDFRLNAMDNSRSYLHDRRNPIKIWSNMYDGSRREETELKDVLDLLIQTGAGPFMNQIDPTDGYRPIDAARPIQRGILIFHAETYGVDMNPTATCSLLAYLVNRDVGVDLLSKVLARIRPDLLDHTDPTTDQTAFRSALTKSFDIAALFVPFAAAGFVDPYLADVVPRINSPSALSVLAVAKRLYDQFTAIHLPNQIAIAWPRMLPQLVRLIVCYSS